MSTRNRRNLLHISSVALVTFILATIIVNMTPNAVVGQDSGNATSTPDFIQDDSPTKMATITICVENLETGEVSCEKTMEPVPEEFGLPSAVSGASSGGTPSVSLSLRKKSLIVGDTTTLTITGQNLLTAPTYSLRVSPLRRNVRTGSGECSSQTSMRIYTYGYLEGYSKFSKTITLRACSAGTEIIKGELIRHDPGNGPEGNTTVVANTFIIVTIAAAPSTPAPTATPTRAPTSTATPAPTATSTPKPTTTPTSRATPTTKPTTTRTPTAAIPKTPAAPTDVRGHWDVNLTPGRRSGHDQYGYHSRSIGAVSDNTFDYENVTYTVEFFKWDDSRNEISLKLDKCLKPSAFSSLRVGEATFDKIGYATYSDSRCERNSSEAQKFDFKTTANPLPLGNTVRVTLLLKLPDPFVIVADTEFPSAEDYVSLTVPDIATTYQWQQWSNGKWTNLGSKTTSPRKRVTSDEAGTRKFRVVANPGTSSSFESPAIYVTWDIWDVALALVTSISAYVATSTDYAAAQTALLKCVNVGRATTVRYASFDDVLADYAGTTKERMEEDGTCETQANKMFDTYERVTKSALARFNTSASEYFLFLESPEGSYFKNDMGDADELRILAAYASAPLPSPGSLKPPFYESTPPHDGAIDPTAPAPSVILGEGLKCLPKGMVGKDLTLANKLRVLNCLVFSTPHDFWVEQVSTSTPSSTSIRNHPRYVDWLEAADWSCTWSPDGPMPACWKHDFAYNGLQRFAGIADEDAWGSELDATWNPFNKALADLRFKADVLKYGCQNPSNIAKVSVCPRERKWLGDKYFWGVAEYNDKNWPVTSADLRGFSTTSEELMRREHDLRYERFEICSEIVFPEIENMRVVPNGKSVTLAWDFKPGCAVGLSDIKLDATWHIKDPRRRIPYTTHNNSDCTVKKNRISCLYDFGQHQSNEIIRHVNISIIPQIREYGGHSYANHRFYVGHTLP